MKIMKKIAAAALASAALFAFVGCSGGDDPNEAITKVSDKVFTVDYENTDPDTYRAYCDTGYKHSGGLFIVELNNQDKAQKDADGVMGIIFDLNGNDSKNFYVVGLNYGYKGNVGKLGYYASKFRNVTTKDLRSNNFGATVSHVYAAEKLEDFNADTNPAELVLEKAFSYADWTPDEKGVVKVAIDIKMDKGAYAINVYKADDVDMNTGKLKDGATAVIGPFDIGTNITGYSKEEQNLLAYYANIYAGRTLSGKWTAADYQNYIQVVEE